jgi:hypothetical protein
LHGRSDAVPVAQIDVIAHADFVAVIDDRRAWEREEEAVHELHLAPIVLDERGEAPPNAEVDAHGLLVGVGLVHVVALLVGHHFERELVVVAQEERPLARRVDGGRLGEDVDEREAVFHVNGHEDPGHDREMEVHLALVAVPVIGGRVLGPLIGLGEEHAVLELHVDVRPEPLQKGVRLLEVLAVGPLALIEVRDGVEAEPVDAEIKPEIDDVEELVLDLGVLEVQIGLV